MTSTSNTHDLRWPRLLLLLPLQLWAAHAVAFFLHEYAHAFTAWLLGWKANPFALDYAHPTLIVFLAQFGINQNVDMAPIFASGHGKEAALIAGAGAVVGNGVLSYPLSRLSYRWATRRGSHAWAMFAYWLTLASVGNFLDYVPLRTFTAEDDMGFVQRGFGWSPWTLLLVLGIPTAAALLYFLLRIEPSTLRWLFPFSPAKRIALAILSALLLFDFYGAAGLTEGGPVSHRLSLITTCLVGPLVLLAEAWALRRPTRPSL